MIEAKPAWTTDIRKLLTEPYGIKPEQRVAMATRWIKCMNGSLIYLEQPESVKNPWVMFDHVRCTHGSFRADVFLNQPDATQQDANGHNPHYVGRLNHIGMGLEDDKGHGITNGVSRVLNADRAVRALNLREADHPTLSLVVTHIDSGLQVAPEDYAGLPGFVAQLVWRDPRQTLMAPESGSGCCSR